MVVLRTYNPGFVLRDIPTEIGGFYGVLGIGPWQAVCNTSNKQPHLTRRTLLGVLFTSDGLQVLGSWWFYYSGAESYLTESTGRSWACTIWWEKGQI